MTRYLLLRQLRRPLVLACLVVPPALACTDTLLNVTDPDIILGANSASSAIGLSNGAVLRLAQAVSGTQGPDALFVFGGLLTDEWRSGDTFIQRNTMDQRIWDPTNTFNAGPFRNLNRVRTQALLAIDGLRSYQPDSVATLARMFDFLAYTQVLLGEHYCNGVPLSGISGTEVIFGEPISNDSLFRLAIANADSALAIAGSDTANAPRIPRRIGTSPKDDGIFDSAFPILVIRQGIWGRTSAVTIASGIEARLIQAEERLRAGDITSWLSIINTRTAPCTRPASGSRAETTATRFRWRCRWRS